jgi:hypothetical protein
MGSYLDLFPKIQYDITKAKLSNFETDTNITFRIGIVKSILSNISAYYEYVVKDGETPEILAGNIYKNPEAYWIILYANEIYDPQYDWPLDYRSFQNFIISKYGSYENAQNIHHYEKIIERQESETEIITTDIYQVNETSLVDNTAPSQVNIPYDTYDTLPDEGEWVTVNLGDGKSVRQRIYRRAVSFYDYEDSLNESKRFIKVIKEEYYNNIHQR